MDDKALIAFFNARNEQAIAHTESKFGNYLTSVAQRILGNLEDAKECVNDTIFRAWNSIPPACPDNLKAYLGKIVRNLAIDRHSSQHSLKRGGDNTTQTLDELAECLPSSEASPDETAEQSALRDCITGYLATQSDENRRMFLQRYWYCCSISDIAERYGMKESRVKMRLLRMREELREWLGKEDWNL
ncbi:MAG: RNA polymerase sigma factor [Oscillospiraceae bacterium]|nr:RNA polymerase sigma factor [Oscillospiraceae bacterium]